MLGRAMSQASATRVGLELEIFRDGIERGENAETAVIQEFGDSLPALGADGIFFGPILAREKAAGKRIIGNHADIGAEAKGFEIGLVIGSVIEIVVGLQAFVAGPGVFFTKTKGFGEAGLVIVGSADDAHFTLLDELRVGL